MVPNTPGYVSRGLMTEVPGFSVWGLPGLPPVKPGDDVARLIAQALSDNDTPLLDGDVLVISSKIISKAENCFAVLADVVPSDKARHYAEITGKDPRIVELILRESVAVSRAAPNVMVTQHRLGFVSANSGIDQSNVGRDGAVLLLPADPDASADRIRADLERQTQARLAVVISDTHGRPFRLGNIGVAIGISGMAALWDRRGETDLFGRQLLATVQGYADLVASAAHLACGEGAEGIPVVVLRGLVLPPGTGRAGDLNRPPDKDLYR